jgi:hypothetical protein
MTSIQLVLGTYNTLPESGDRFFEEAYQGFCKPFLSALYNHPSIPVVLYYMGPLLEWMEEQHPEAFMLLKEMGRRKQVEFLGGAFYEPILPLIPDSDKLGQLEKMTTYVRSRFGTRPRGAWITERIWEPSLAKVLKNGGMDYTFLDDHFFHIAGLGEEVCCHPYLTEDQGKSITVFPMTTRLTATIPATSPEKLLARLRKLGDESGQKVVTLLFPGDRFSVREGGENGAYHWLEAFLAGIAENRRWLQTVTPQTYLKQNQHRRRRVYFPCLSHPDVMRWVLTCSQQKSLQTVGRKVKNVPNAALFLRRGHVRQFLMKYPEIDLLYARMMYTHLLVNQIRGDKYKKQAASNELWKGQANAVYWNGPHGGIYSNALRKAAYRAFLEAERLTRGSALFMPSIMRTDFDLDGQEEYLYQGRLYNAYIHRCGGSVVELDYVPAAWNYLDTMARWPESYHLSEEEGCDTYSRKSFLDHFFAGDTKLASFENMHYQEQGDFLTAGYELAELKREKKEIILQHVGKIRRDNREYDLKLVKHYRFRKSSIVLQLSVDNLSGSALDLWYGMEMNFALAGADTESFRIFGFQEDASLPVEDGAEVVGGCFEIGNDRREAAGLNAIKINDNVNKVLIGFEADAGFHLWSLPVETSSPEAAGKQYQSSCLLPSWRFRLEPGGQWKLRVTLSLEKESA